MYCDKLDDLTDKQQEKTTGSVLIETTIKCNKLQQPKPVKDHIKKTLTEKGAHAFVLTTSM